MSQREVAVGLNASSQPTGGLGIRTEQHLGGTYIVHPHVGNDIARGETQSLEYMTFGLRGAAHQIFMRGHSLIDASSTNAR